MAQSLFKQRAAEIAQRQKTRFGDGGEDIPAYYQNQDAIAQLQGRQTAVAERHARIVASQQARLAL